MVFTVLLATRPHLHQVRVQLLTRRFYLLFYVILVLIVHLDFFILGLFDLIYYWPYLLDILNKRKNGRFSHNLLKKVMFEKNCYDNSVFLIIFV